VTRPLDRPVAGDGRAAGALGLGVMAFTTQRDRAFVRANRRYQRIVAEHGVVGVRLGDGRLRAGIVPSRPAMSSRARRLLAHEVIQTSAMDCGPAALSACWKDSASASATAGSARRARRPSTAR